MKYIHKVIGKLMRHFSGLYRRRRLTREMALRIVADTVMVNVALFAALTLRYLWFVIVEGDFASDWPVYGDFVAAYLSTIDRKSVV